MRSFAERASSAHPLQDEQEISGVWSRRSHEQTTSPEEPSFEDIREAVTHRLMHDAGLPETIRVAEVGRNVRIEYEDAAKEELFRVFLNWMQPLINQVETIIEKRLQDKPLSTTPDEIERVRLSLRRMMTGALQTATFSGPKPSYEGGMTFKDQVTQRVLAMRAILLHRPDWLAQLDASTTRSSLPEVNQLLGFAGIFLDEVPAHEFRRLHLAVREGALVPDQVKDVLDENVFTESREEGEALRERFDARMYAVQYLGELKASLMTYEAEMGNLQNVLRPQKEMERIMDIIKKGAKRILEIDARKQRNNAHVVSEETAEYESSFDQIKTSNDALEQEHKKLLAERAQLLRLRDVYWDIAGQLGNLESSGIVLSHTGPVTIQGLIALVSQALHERSVPAKLSTYAE